MGTVQSIDRALAMLTETAQRPGGLSDLARRVGLPTTTAARLLATLERAGTVTRDDDGVYRIGPTIVAMAQAAGTAARGLPPLEIAARRHLSSLANATGEAAGICVPIGDAIHSIAQIDAPKPVRAQDWTGRSWPLHVGGSGIAVLSTYSDADVAAYLERHRGVGARALRKRIRAAAGDGVCWSHGDYSEELSSVAAPVLDHSGRAVGALFVYGPSYRFPGTDAVALEQLVIGQACELSATVGVVA